MRGRALSCLALFAMFFLGLAGIAHADICVKVDDARDTLSPSDRTAALLLLAREFELAGEQVAEPGCPGQYVVSHVKLGDTISVTLTGPNGRRDAVAVGLDDLPAVYNQMVRSLLTGLPMRLGGVDDRPNASVTQAANLLVHSDSIFSCDLGSG